MFARVRESLLASPSRGLAVSFAGAIAVGTLLLMLPWAAAGPERQSVVTSLFTSTSAVCVTGLTVVNTGTEWSDFGKVVILLLMQIGGLGIMTLATLIPIAFTNRASIAARLAAQSHTGALTMADLKVVMRGAMLLTFTVEAFAALVLTLRFWATYDYSWSRAVGHGVFHSVSAFNNAGFALYRDSLSDFSGDWIVNAVVMIAIVLGGLGFAVVAEVVVRRQADRSEMVHNSIVRRIGRRAHRWSLHTKLTLATTAVLLVGFAVVFLVFEWTNPLTLGPLSVSDKILAGMFQSVTPRTAGFNTVDIAGLNEPTRLTMSGLMFIGGGSASTAGGIKVSTVAVLAAIAWADLRGDRDVNVARRRLGGVVQREAFVIFVVALSVGFAGSVVLDALSRFPLEDTAFEAFSALGTVGLSTGITPRLSSVAQLTLVAMMFLGRVGPATLGSAVVARRRRRNFRYPQDGPLVG